MKKKHLPVNMDLTPSNMKAQTSVINNMQPDGLFSR